MGNQRLPNDQNLKLRTLKNMVSYLTVTFWGHKQTECSRKPHFPASSVTVAFFLNSSNLADGVCMGPKMRQVLNNFGVYIFISDSSDW